MKSVDQKRFRPVLIVNERGPLTHIVEECGIEIAIVPFVVAKPAEMLRPKNIAGNIRASFEISRVMRERHVEIIQCTDIFAIVLLLPTLLKMRLPLIYNVIVFYSVFRSCLLNILAFLYVDHIVTNSFAVKKDLLRKTIGIASKTTVAYNGVDMSRFYPRNVSEKTTTRRSLGLPFEKKVIGFIGRYEVWKGHLTFVEAAYQLLRSRDDLCFLMIGGPITSRVAPQVSRYQEEVLRKVRQMGLNGKLIVWDHRNDIAEIMAALDVFVCPSDYEPFGLVVLEAWESGLPLVVTRTVGAIEVLKGKLGIIVAEPRNTTSFVDGIERALSIPLSDISGKRVYGEHGWQSYARQFEALYEKVGA